MSHRPISRSPDLKRLRDEGYDVSIRTNHLVVSSVPYVTTDRAVAYGVLVSELTLAGDVAARPNTHVAYFIGSYPCMVDGTPIEQIRHGSGGDLGGGLLVDHSFSNKPSAGYADYHEKMTRYIDIISAPAQAIDSDATARVFPVVVPGEDEEDAVFNYMDTASSRAGIGAASDKLRHLRSVCIIGTGGTGSYVLDLIAKTPVNEIHLFDGDTLLTHNAFRSPGAPSLDELRAKPKKVDHLAAIYSRMRKHMIPHRTFIGPEELPLLAAAQFVFLCIDAGPAKRLIVDYLIGGRIPFIDVGMGINLVDRSLGGILRTTFVTPPMSAHVLARISFAEDEVDNDYSQNIQVADLNALNAVLAVIKWKKWAGFYRDLECEHNSSYVLDTNTLINEDQ